MSPRLNRLFYIVATATVWLWGGALCGLWVHVFDATGASLWLTASAMLAAFAVGLAVPAQFFRLVQAVLRRLRPHGALAMPLVAPAAADTPYPVARLLGVALIVAAAGGLLSAMGLKVCSGMVSYLMAGFLAGPAMQLAVRFFMQLAAMLGWGVAAGVVWQAQCLAYTGRRVGAKVLSPSGVGGDWLLGLAAALAVASLSWQMGWDPLIVALTTGAVQVACGLILIRWPGRSVPVKPKSPTAILPPVLRTGFGISVTAAAATLTAELQLRGLADLLGATVAEQMLYGGASIALAAALYRRWACRAKGWSALSCPGAVVLVCTALAMQWALGLASLYGRVGGVRWLAGVAMCAQAPLVAGVMVLAMERRERFFSAGGSARHAMQWLLSGLAAGAVGGVIVIGSRGMQAALLSALLVCVGGAIVVGIGRCRRTDRQVVWSVAGAALLLAMAVGPTVSYRQMRDKLRVSVSAGRWLTAWWHRGDSGYLPMPTEAPECRLDLLAAGMVRKAVAARAICLAAGRGFADMASDPFVDLMSGQRWLVVSCRPLLDDGQDGLTVVSAAADPAFGRLAMWRGRDVRAILPVLRTGPFQFNGLFYGPIRADHPAGRVLFNAATIDAVVGRVADGGVLIVHATCAGANVAPMLAVAKTVHERLGESLVAVRVDGRGAELLVFGCPNRSADCLAVLIGPLREQLANDAIILPGSRLAGIWADVPIVGRVGAGACGAGAYVGGEELSALLKQVRVQQDIE
ncbi:MAG: hypothetical protein HQ546_07930 [Planctomycetes bacterium]|nr:hypothetical protein [Planctomycetota bacterium]